MIPEMTMSFYCKGMALFRVMNQTSQSNTADIYDINLYIYWYLIRRGSVRVSNNIQLTIRMENNVNKQK